MLYIDSNSDSKKSIYDLYQVILSNGFSQLRRFITKGPPLDSTEMTYLTGSSTLCSFELVVKTVHDFNIILNICPHLHRIHVSCFGLQQKPQSTVLTFHATVKHLELKCNHPSTAGIFLLSIPNIVTLKLVITTWPTHDLFEQLAADFKLPSLQVLICLVAASQTRSYPMSFETLSEHYIKNLHPLFKYVTIKQEDNEYCEDGDDVEWNKYDFQMRYFIHESVEIKSFM